VTNDITYSAELDLVLGEYWVAVYKDGRNRVNVRLVSQDDAWDFDVQKGMSVRLKSMPKNRCKILKVLRRPL